MGVFEFLKKREKNPDYTKAVRKVGVWKKAWRSKPGTHPYIEKDREMSRLIQIGSSPINIQEYVAEKSNQNLLIIGATGQGKSKLMRLILEMFPNPKTIFSFKKRDEYLQIDANVIYAEKSLPNPFSDSDAFTSAFAVASGISSTGIQSNIAMALIRTLAEDSSSWTEFTANAAKLQKSKDNNTRAAVAYILQKIRNFAYDPNQIKLDLAITNVIDFSYLNEEAKTFYAELFLRQIYNQIREGTMRDKVIICVDEAHRLTKTKDAEKSSVFGEMSREVRAFGMLWTATQNLTDLPDAVRNQFATQFCFNTTSEEDMRALSAVNRQLAQCASSLKKHEFADAKVQKVHDEIPIYMADVSVLKENVLEARRKEEPMVIKSSVVQDRPTPTLHAGMQALYNNPDASLRDLTAYLKTQKWITSDATIYGSKDRRGVFDSLVSLGYAVKEKGGYKLKEKALDLIDPVRLLAKANNSGSDLHKQLFRKAVEHAHKENMLTIVPEGTDVPDLVVYPMSQGKKKYLWEDKKKRAYEIQTTARKDSIQPNAERDKKLGLPITWITYDKNVIEAIKELTESKDEYLLINL